ncbi:MAG: PQQ-binding-like beta-propeller repeat protein, partial [Octadecabacter sp.]|nr:PQQ-binding-like beta-propeller repeat protein [Octadecabacter sp.]
MTRYRGADMTGKSILATVAAFGLLAACGEKDVILPGERLDIRGADLAETVSAPNEVRPLSLATPVVNADWTHRNGSPSHTIPHPALNTALAPLFATNIGAGDGRRMRITADPVVQAVRIFTMDAQSSVRATSTAGVALWARSVIPPTDNPRDASGGGLAVAGDVLVATTGFGELVALDVGSGGEIWRQDLDAPGTS